jgi:hypothetical protein
MAKENVKAIDLKPGDMFNSKIISAVEPLRTGVQISFTEGGSKYFATYNTTVRITPLNKK